MDQNFQTSFIPKKPIVEEKVVVERQASLFTVVAIFIFFSVLIGSGGLYFYKEFLKKQTLSLSGQLEIVKGRFESSKISEMQVLGKRLEAATDVLSKHVAISPIFQSLQDLTLKTIRYTKFTYTIDDAPNALFRVKMSGAAVGYRSVALQADLFNKNKYITDPVFSNLSLDPKGNVLFDLEFTVSPVFINYEQLLKTTQNI